MFTKATFGAYELLDFAALIGDDISKELTDTLETARKERGLKLCFAVFITGLSVSYGVVCFDVAKDHPDEEDILAAFKTDNNLRYEFESAVDMVVALSGNVADAPKAVFDPVAGSITFAEKQA